MQSRTLLGILVLLLCVDGCKDEEPTTPPATDLAADSKEATDLPAADIAVEAGDASDEADTAAVKPLPEVLPDGLSSTGLLGQAHGLRPLRTIIHAHTIYSHDACDGEPILENGEPNEECLASFRTALCTDRIDVVMLTEHYGHMAEELDFEKLFLHREGDEWVEEDGKKVANAVVCADGHRALIVPGLEGSGGKVSVIGLFDHPGKGDAAAIEAAYKDETPAGTQTIRDHGGLPVAIHLENATPEWLKDADIDAVEVGNLHILVAPDIRKQVGLDPDIPVVAFTNWLFSPELYPDPDFVFLEFHERLDLYHEWWDGVLQHKRITGFAGNDVHQNVLDFEMGDGDRPDSYRRMMKWYTNYVLVADTALSSVREAITAGRLFMVFEILGSPAGLDFRAESGEDTWLMGDVVPEGARNSDAGLRLIAPIPVAFIEDASVTTEPTMRLFRIDSEGSEKVTEVEGALDYVVEKPGRYRLEIFVMPTHLSFYLDGHDQLMRPLPWVYSNVIEVE